MSCHSQFTCIFRIAMYFRSNNIDFWNQCKYFQNAIKWGMECGNSHLYSNEGINFDLQVLALQKTCFLVITVISGINAINTFFPNAIQCGKYKRKCYMTTQLTLGGFNTFPYCIFLAGRTRYTTAIIIIANRRSSLRQNWKKTTKEEREEEEDN